MVRHKEEKKWEPFATDALGTRVAFARRDPLITKRGTFKDQLYRGGIELDAPFSPATGLQASRTDWTVGKRRLFSERLTPDENGKRAILMPQVAVIRNEDETPFGVVSEGYGLAQNREVLACFVGDKASLIALGERDGGRMFARVALPTSYVPAKGGPDALRRTLRIDWGHGGTSSVKTSVESIRQVCGNGMIRVELDDRHVYRHTNGILAAMDMGAALHAEALRAIEDQDRELATFAAREITNEDAARVVAASVPGEHSRAIEARARILALFDGQADGAELAGHTAWGLLNAVTEFVTHERPMRGVSTPDERRARFELEAPGEEVSATALQHVRVLVGV